MGCWLITPAGVATAKPRMATRVPAPRPETTSGLWPPKGKVVENFWISVWSGPDPISSTGFSTCTDSS
jgi:hypothetical protein